jgi:hypothetical protein
MPLDNVWVTLRRILLILVTLILVALMTVLLLAPDSVSTFINNISTVLRLIIVMLLYLGVLAVLYITIRRGERPSAGGLIVKSSGTTTVLDVESARERIQAAITNLPKVESAQTEVKSVRGRADVTLTVAVQSDSEALPRKQQEINRTLEQVIKKQLGLQMASRPTVQLSFNSLDAYLPDTVEALPPPGETTDEDTSSSPRSRPQLGKRFGRRTPDRSAEVDTAAEDTAPAEINNEETPTDDDEVIEGVVEPVTPVPASEESPKTDDIQVETDQVASGKEDEDDERRAPSDPPEQRDETNRLSP